MSQHSPTVRRSRRLRATCAAAAALAACVLVAACGGSSTSSAGTQAASTNPSAAGGPAGAGGAGVPAASNSHFKQLRACLEKHGVTLPSPGSGGQQSQSSTSRAKMQEAFKACGGHAFAGGPHGAFGGAHRAQFQAAYKKFAGCMRENGIDLPTANTSGNGPIFNTKGVDTQSSKFKEAEKKCSSDLPHLSGPPSGSPGGAGGAPGYAPAGAPPA